ncbi:MAG TPA: antibiotic biosynthesis monooxygenase [Kofleriaceae bacterium]|jgi:heme-degrading monooxygenase HmoA
MAFVRVGRFKAKPELVAELCQTYQDEAIPRIRAARGNVSAVLFQPHRDDDDFLAITIWQTQADAERYEVSGQAAEIVAKVRHTFAAPPALATYDALGIPAAS